MALDQLSRRPFAQIPVTLLPSSYPSRRRVVYLFQDKALSPRFTQFARTISRRRCIIALNLVSVILPLFANVAKSPNETHPTHHRACRIQ